MNPGYLSTLLVLISMIMCVCGWKNILMRGIPAKAILLFFALWFISICLCFTVTSRIFLIWLLLILLLSLIVLWKQAGIIAKLHAIAVGLLIGSLFFVMQEASNLSLSWIGNNEAFYVAILIGLLVASTIKLPSQQMASLTLGFILGEIYYLNVSGNHVGIRVTFLELSDRWWLTLFVTRGISMFMLLMLVIRRYSLLFLIHARKSKWRKRLHKK